MSIFNINKVQFTEEEYHLWFNNGKKSLLLKNVKIELDKRSIQYNNKVKKEECEQFVFNNIIREKADICNNFALYKKYMARFSFLDVKAYVRNKRQYRRKISPQYIDLVTGIILSDKNHRNLLHSEIVTLINGRTMLDMSKQDEKHFKCSHTTMWDTNYEIDSCACCRYNVILFANDCVIKLGRDKFERDFHLFYIFSHSVSERLVVKDIIILISKFYFCF